MTPCQTRRVFVRCRWSWFALACWPADSGPSQLRFALALLKRPLGLLPSHDGWTRGEAASRRTSTNRATTVSKSVPATRGISISRSTENAGSHRPKSGNSHSRSRSDAIPLTKYEQTSLSNSFRSGSDPHPCALRARSESLPGSQGPPSQYPYAPEVTDNYALKGTVSLLDAQ